MTPLKVTKGNVEVQLGILTEALLAKASHFPPITVMGLFTGMVMVPVVSVTAVEPIKVVGAVPEPLSS